MKKIYVKYSKAMLKVVDLINSVEGGDDLQLPNDSGIIAEPDIGTLLNGQYNEYCLKILDNDSLKALVGYLCDVVADYEQGRTPLSVEEY